MNLEKFKKVVTSKYFVFPLIFAVAFLLYLPQSHNVYFGDEFDVTTGAWLVSKGYVVYSDFFCHHMPTSYVIIAIFTSLGISTVAGLRIAFHMCFVFVLILFYNLLKDKVKLKYYCCFIILYIVSMPYYWGMSVLADVISASATTIFLFIILNKPDMEYTLLEKCILSITTFIAITSLQMAVVAYIIYYLFYAFKRIYLYITSKKAKILFMEDLKFFIIVLTPFIIWIIYMIITNSFSNFLEFGIMFNFDYYSSYVNETNIIGLIIKNLIDLPTYIYTTFTGLLDFDNFENVYRSIITLAFFSMTAINFKKNKLHSVLIFLFVYYLGIRNRNTFRAAAYFVALEVCFCYLLNVIELSKIRCRYKSSLIIIASSIVALVIGTDYKVRVLENGKDDLTVTINSEYEKIIRDVTTETDKIWSLPMSPDIYLNTEREPADGNIFYLPWQADIPGYNESVVANLIREKPKIIISDKNAIIWNESFGKVSDYAEPIVKYVDENYFRIADEYPNLYFSKESKQEILKALYDNGWISHDRFKQDQINSETNLALGPFRNDIIVQKLNKGINGLVGLKLQLGNYEKPVDGYMKISLFGLNDEVIYEQSFQIRDIRDNQWNEFLFDNVINDEVRGIQLGFSISNGEIAVYGNDIYDEKAIIGSERSNYSVGMQALYEY